ncbi:ABC transporter substrate-binding protein [Allonocardiopsis opalescens]|uniref:Polar amino acid transport system substrate-binding protein n=1 Tax=Allonocardiopsis opalescens TaxID=1144618 RepID=A0A2T0PU95_9ACTN|nr:ABC transporter substrate-binding protein [Allonocardiopsis opalescens]PRX92475.1 polar amino acid transport system substrate-binding protein [Allonocardiopsis opalescens]
MRSSRLRRRATPPVRFPSALAALAGLAAVAAAAACAPVDEEPAAGGSPSATACEPGALPTLEEGVLTIGTDAPAYPPWFVDDDPANGEGYESAVAYAVAERLGYSADQVAWTTVAFNTAIAPGPKPFDFDINQFSITEERREAVDFSSSYYDVRQAVITMEGTSIEDAASIADLADARLGAQVGTTSYQAVTELIQPNEEPSVFNNNDDARLALENGEVDGIVVDVPTAFYMTGAQLDGGVVVGQLPPIEGAAEQFGLVLDLGSPLTDCVTAAVDGLREDGTLAELERQWLAEAAGAPELS